MEDYDFDKKDDLNQEELLEYLNLFIKEDIY